MRYLLILCTGLFALNGCSSSSDRTFVDETAGSGGTSAGGSSTAGSTSMAGAGGTSGTSGTGGSSGTNGTSGTSGTSGSSGDAGSSGTSGAAGDAGSSGSAGTGGSSGSGGDAGSGGSAGTGTSGTGGSGGSAPTCDGANHCVGVPSGWTGPITYAPYTGSAPPCPSSFPNSDYIGHQGLTPGNASCSCSCGAINLTCGIVTSTAYGSSSCGSPVGSISMPLNQCIVVNGSYPTTNSFNFKISSSSSCGAPSVNNSIPKPAWGNNFRVCGGASDISPGACPGNEICLPPAGAPYGSICVYKDGNNACPAGFGIKEVVYKSFTDSRACSSCSCQPSNDVCIAAVTRYQNALNDCSGSTSNLNVTETGSSCITKASQTSFRTTSITKNPSAICAKSGGTLSGTAAEAEATTICCQ
jgi:hypothetical protein